MELGIGQIWREVDTKRFVRIEAIYEAVFIRTVRQEGDRWSYTRGQTRAATKERFNGKPRGYAFHAPSSLLL